MFNLVSLAVSFSYNFLITYSVSLLELEVSVTTSTCGMMYLTDGFNWINWLDLIGFNWILLDSGWIFHLNKSQVQSHQFDLCIRHSMSCTIGQLLSRLPQQPKYHDFPRVFNSLKMSGKKKAKLNKFFKNIQKIETSGRLIFVQNNCFCLKNIQKNRLRRAG